MRIVYFAEIFPSKSETWVHHEIMALQGLGCTVQVFATHPKPRSVPAQLAHFVDITTYLPELQWEWRHSLRAMIDRHVLVPVLSGLSTDCRGFRRKAQVLRDLIYAARFAPSMLRFRPNLLVAHFAGTRTNLALFLSLYSRIPFVFKMHASDVFNRVALFRLKTTKAARIFTISDYNIKFISSRYPDIDTARFERHACGIPLSEYPFQPVRLKSGMPTILAVGRLVRMKGFDVLLRASSIMVKQGLTHRVVILGDGPERDRLEELVWKLGLGEVVELRGYASPSEVRRIVQSAAMFVLPAVWDRSAGTMDGVPVALMEAMAMGVQVISTTTSGIPELITDGVSGLLASPNDPEDLARKIMHGLNMSMAERQIMLQSARRKIEEEHDVHTLTWSLLRLLETEVQEYAIAVS